jgi:hypothetical protein
MIFEATGGYQVALIVNVALGVAAAIAAALVPRFGHERQRRPSAVTAPETSSLPASASG